MQLFGTKGQKFHHCPGTKGQRDKLKILPRDGTGRDSQNSGRAGTAKIRDGTRDKTGNLKCLATFRGAIVVGLFFLHFLSLSVCRILKNRKYEQFIAAHLIFMESRLIFDRELANAVQGITTSLSSANKICDICPI